jgi:MoxR-like ATPase
MVNQPFLRINGRQDMESDSLIGRPTISEGTMGYKLGEWPKASKKGWLVLFDEPWKTPPGIMMTIQPHLERGGIWYIEDMPGEAIDKQIVPKSSYRCVLADNVVGTGDNVEQYAATMIQDGSSLNRVDYVLRVGYLKPELEVDIMKKQFPEIAEHTAKKMISLLNLLRNGYDNSELSSPASLRNIEAWARAAIAFKSVGIGFKHTLMNRYADDSEAAAVRNHFSTCFGEKLS